jgi:tRNA modification GTPase
MNCLLGENRSITSSVSGTTRDTITSEITLSGVPALLIDTAGITNTDNPIEKEGVLRASKEIERADIIISMSSPKIKKIETKHSKKTIHVYNKTDSIKAGLVKKPSYFYISALNNQGVDLLLERLKLLVTENNFSTDSTINNLRQKDALEKSLSSLTSALNILKNNKPELELVAFEIKDSMNFLSVFLGKVNSEDVLNGVFSNFCVGK